MPADPRRYWYGRMGAKPSGRAQVGRQLDRVRSIDLPEHVLRLAHTEYVNQYGSQQDYERMQERSGLSVLEVIGLLADLAERHGAQPYPPRATTEATDAG
jgi:hypothetical protein